MARVKFFHGKYSKSYKDVNGAIKAIDKFEAKYDVAIRSEYKEMAMSWIMTIDGDNPSRVIPACTNPKSSTIMHLCIENGHPVTGVIGG